VVEVKVTVTLLRSRSRGRGQGHGYTVNATVTITIMVNVPEFQIMLACTSFGQEKSEVLQNWSVIGDVENLCVCVCSLLELYTKKTVFKYRES
jgi:hypothetical protein